MRKEIVIAVGWFGAVAAAAVVGVATISALGGTGTGDPPLSQQDVNSGLIGASGPGSPVPSRSAVSPSTGGSAAVRKYISSPGGTFWAACVDDLVTLDSVSPSQGFRVDGKQLGPAASVWVKFKLDVRRGHAAEYTVTVNCLSGAPQEHVSSNG